jgi:PH domain
MSARLNDEVSLSGYLYKKTRDGRWQKRWFETSGVYLTYYKSKKMEKLLAALSLPQVGGIRIISADEDPEKIEGVCAPIILTVIFQVPETPVAPAAF